MDDPYRALWQLMTPICDDAVQTFGEKDMKTPSLSRCVPGLMAGVTLAVSCFLFSGCNYAVRQKTIFGPDLRQLPAVVLSPQNGSHDFVFDWRVATIGGTPMLTWKPDKRYWRLNVFRFKNGMRIGGNKDGWKDFQKDEYTETFSAIVFDRLIRVDLDLTDDPNGSEKDEPPWSLYVLLHDVSLEED